MFRSALRHLALFGALALCASAASAAIPYAQGRYDINSQIRPADVHETASRFRVEGKNNAGALIVSQTCPTLASCSAALEGTATWTAVLDLDADREEVVFERCKGVLSTVPQLRCENGFLDVTLRTRTGHLEAQFVSDDGAMLGGTATIRFEFEGDPAKYWEGLQTRWYDSAAKAHRFPAGRYKVFAPPLASQCSPVPSNSGVTFDLPAGGRVPLSIRYRATECLVEIAADIDIANLRVTSDAGDFDCVAKGQTGVASTKTVCSRRVPFDRPFEIRADVPAGLQPSFSGACIRGATGRTTCPMKPRSDHRTDGFTNIRLTTQAASTPPAPEPVALGLARGASSPSDGVVVKGSASTPMLQLRATASNGTAMLGALTVKASGNGRDDLDLAMVKLVADANGNGVFDSGETVLAQGRPAADNGELQLVLGSAMPMAAGADLLLVADIASDVHQAAAAWAGTGVVLAMGLVAWPATRRRASPRALAAVLAALVAFTALAGCGGGSDEPAEAPVAEAPPDAPPPAPVLLTYRLDVTGFAATDTATPPQSLAAPVLVEGATVTVRQ